MNKKTDLKLKDCACKRLRMSTRIVTQFYDNAFRKAGLKSTQYSLLKDIASRQGGISVNELANLSLMDQTTVTRNIEILRKNELITVKTADIDSRKKCIAVSEAGKERLTEATPIWKETQRQVQELVGEEKYEAFLEVLSCLENLK
ncbi:MarR family transcriptional regulator [Anaerocolumna cellulosilytica]|uniref:MarR family transcriptional regulator n=1 Tax=Anaerocolumna cellulosilytica TaxID=433286 RepID=A0A6S6QW72_9FIRM|nr:MarR family winged helix-turn-helix transcriptional regulator [Anaerocolumna cellulosilytica]MBB5196694.1 DNA-binding MarR family transcriptional regulator [Anaerocolumna cellulosilytica]BCJ93956.1 MarR family transcriptional regulator [Anaerocolumna cellulosilytica]